MKKIFSFLASFLPALTLCAVPFIAEQPVIDGDLSEPVWRKIPWRSSFTLIGTKEPAAAQTRFKTYNNGDYLFFAVECDEPDTARLVRKPYSDGSGLVWMNDSVEISLVPDSRVLSFYKIIADSNGASTDFFGQDDNTDQEKYLFSSAWKSGAAVKTRITSGKWTLEAAIPFGAMNFVPANSDKWRINVARNRWWGYDYRTDCEGDEIPSADWFLQLIREDFRKKNEMAEGIYCNGKLIGEVVLHRFGYACDAEVGARLLPEYEGRGYASEAVRAMAAYAFVKLGLERMAHGVNAIRDLLTEQDRDNLKRMMISESDWLLEFYPVEAGLIGSSGKNKPESNIWNGGFLWRAALDYPDAPDAALWREKGTRFLLNGISHALDAASERRFDGRPLREWHVGFNFTPNYSLDHHGYMNVGYSIICLSNLAMLHFNFRERGQNPPEALSLHVDDLWHTVKNFFFDDGRLLRIGGDTRARYTYCQCYALPALWLAADFLRDADAVRLRERYLELLFQEQDSNRDGSFYGVRLRGLREQSYYYYTRLESDPALVLSQELWWARLASLPEPAAEPLPASSWHDSFRRSGGALPPRRPERPGRVGGQSPLPDWIAPARGAAGAFRRKNRGGLFRSLRLGGVGGGPAIRRGGGALSGRGEPVCGRGAAGRAEHAGAGAGRSFEREHV